MDPDPKNMELAFSWRGNGGLVRIECVPNLDPDYWGAASSATDGYPVCTATVDYPSLGYRSMFGWVQLVRSTDNESAGDRFELDPFALFGDVLNPYCWYGTRPILFDAPSRATRQPLEWVAHSFLATTPLEEIGQSKPRRVVPVVGFSWGFTDDGSAVTLHELSALSRDEWAMHLGLLRDTYKWWLFADAPEP
jgi:hypothetical protein